VRISPAALKRLSAADSELLDRLTPELAEHIDHPSFACRDAERKMFGRVSSLCTDGRAEFRQSMLDDGADLARTRNLPTLSAEQEQHLFQQYNYVRSRVGQIVATASERPLAGRALRNMVAWARVALGIRSRIVQVNLPLVLAMAKRTRLSGVDFNELISEGNMALLRSADKFDCGRGFKFSTYACRAILKSFSRVAMRASRYHTRFPVEFDPTMEKSDFLDKKRESVQIRCIDELRQILEENLADLSSVEQKVIRERFAVTPVGVEDLAGPKTLEQVGSIIGVTKERVRQIQNKALGKIRIILEEGVLAA